MFKCLNKKREKYNWENKRKEKQVKDKERIYESERCRSLITNKRLLIGTEVKFYKYDIQFFSYSIFTFITGVRVVQSNVDSLDKLVNGNFWLLSRNTWDSIFHIECCWSVAVFFEGRKKVIVTTALFTHCEGSKKRYLTALVH